MVDVPESAAGPPSCLDQLRQGGRDREEGTRRRHHPEGGRLWLSYLTETEFDDLGRPKTTVPLGLSGPSAQHLLAAQVAFVGLPAVHDRDVDGVGFVVSQPVQPPISSGLTP